MQYKYLLQISLLFILISFAPFIYAQNLHFIKLEAEIIEISNRNFYIADIADKRLDKDNIGFVQKGLFNNRAFANLEGGLANGLKNYLNLSLPKNNEMQTPVTLNIYQFNVGEKTGAMKETGWFDISVGFSTLKNGQFVEIYRTNAKEENNGMDVTAAHQRRIKKALTICLENFSKKNIQTEENVAEIQKESEMDTTAITMTFDSPYVDNTQEIENHILTCTQKKVGIYKSFDEFIHNSPSVLKFKADFTRDNFAMIRDEKTNKKIKDAYGFCDGNNFYINSLNYSMKKQYVKVLASGRYFAWLDNYYDGGDAAVNGAIGGALGVLVMGGGGDLDCICMSFDTGAITPLNKKMLELILKDDKELLESYAKNNNKRNAIFQLELIKRYNQKHPIK